MVRISLVVCVAFAGAFSPAVSAQSTVAQAIQQARAASKAVLAEHKVHTGEALAEYKTALHALVAGLQADQFGVPLMQAFLDSAQAFQVEVAVATEEAEEAIADAFSLALSGLATSQGAPFDGAFPAGFHSGDSGACDDQIALLRKAVSKLYGKVRKAGDATISKARAADVGLTLQFFEPPRRGFFGPSESGTIGTFHNPVIVHLVVGASRLDTGGDGIALVAGTGSIIHDVTVQLFTEDAVGDPVVLSADTTPESVPGVGGAWSMLMDEKGKGLPEGNYNLDAFIEGELTAADANLGVP
jgi:hypothetical protein